MLIEMESTKNEEVELVKKEEIYKIIDERVETKIKDLKNINNLKSPYRKVEVILKNYKNFQKMVVSLKEQLNNIEIVKKINEFTKLSKERELTEEEKKEREKYRRLYIDKFKESLKGHLDNIKIVKVDDEGNPVDDDGNIIPAEA